MKKKSLSYDEITSKILQACASLISHPLSYIYNSSLYTGIFPDPLKIAVVKPIYKKGDKIRIKNYIIKCFFCKVFEKAMHSRLSQHLPTNNMQVTEQYGFRKGIWTENGALILTDSVFKYIIWKSACWRNFPWFGKGLWLRDSWNVVSLITFMWNLRRLEDWLRAYLNNRRQKVKVKSVNTSKNFSSSAVHWSMEFQRDQF